MVIDPIALAHSTADAHAFEHAVLSACQRAVGCDVAFFFVPGERPSTLGIDPAALEAALNTHTYDAEIARLKQAAQQTQGVAIDTEVLGEAGVQCCEYYRHFMQPIGGRHGGAVAMRQFKRLHPQLAIDIVEADPQVLEWANRWYGLAALSGVATTCTDAASFVSAAPSAHWDVVVVDVYDDSCLSEELLSSSFMIELARTLRTGGALAFNVVGALSGSGPVQQVERAARQALHDVRLIPVLDPGESFSPHALRNVVVLGSKR